MISATKQKCNDRYVYIMVKLLRKSGLRLLNHDISIQEPAASVGDVSLRDSGTGHGGFLEVMEPRMRKRGTGVTAAKSRISHMSQ